MDINCSLFTFFKVLLWQRPNCCKIVSKIIHLTPKNEGWLSISFLGVFFPNSHFSSHLPHFYDVTFLTQFCSNLVFVCLSVCFDEIYCNGCCHPCFFLFLKSLYIIRRRVFNISPYNASYLLDMDNHLQKWRTKKI